MPLRGLAALGAAHLQFLRAQQCDQCQAFGRRIGKGNAGAAGHGAGGQASQTWKALAEEFKMI